MLRSNAASTERAGLADLRPQLHPRLRPRPGASGLRPARRSRATSRTAICTAPTTLMELGGRIGVDGKNLLQTVQEHNRYAVTGVDEAFGKGGTEYNQFNGDPANKPNPCLRPIAQPPFFAVAVYPSTMGTCVGPCDRRRCARARRQTARRSRDSMRAATTWRRCSAASMSGPGITLGPALVFAYRAVMRMKRRIANSEWRMASEAEVRVTSRRIAIRYSLFAIRPLHDPVHQLGLAAPEAIEILQQQIDHVVLVLARLARRVRRDQHVRNVPQRRRVRAAAPRPCSRGRRPRCGPRRARRSAPARRRPCRAPR